MVNNGTKRNTNRKFKRQYKKRPTNLSKALTTKRGDTRYPILPVFKLFPNSQMVKMAFTLSSGSGTDIYQNAWGSAKTIKLNSIAAPHNSTSGSYRAQGWDEIHLLYQKYKVFGARVTIRASNPTQDGLYIGYRVLNSKDGDGLSGEYLGPSQVKKWTFTKPINNTGTQVVTMSKYWDIASVEGLSKLQFAADVDNYCANIDQSPVNVPELDVCICNTANNTDANMFVEIHVEYVVQLYNRLVLSNSVIA